MELTSFSQKENQVSFNIKGIDAGVLNALRRTIVAGVPTLAIERVRIINNDSILNDEMLAHRLGLVPIKGDVKKLVTPQECKCEDKRCDKCSVTLNLEVDGPGSVYSGSLTSNQGASSVYQTIPLVKLLDNQKVELESDAILGYGREHIKWQPGVAGYEIKKTHIEVFIESFGQHDISDLIKTSLEVFSNKIKEVQEKTK